MLRVGVCSAVVSVPCSILVTCWERADLLAVVFVVFCHFPNVLFMSCVMLSRQFIAALWSPVGKGLTSWLLFVKFNCVFATFP